MQELINQKTNIVPVDINNMTLEERQKLVGAFVWLFQQYEKQSPAQKKKIMESKNYDRYSMPIDQEKRGAG